MDNLSADLSTGLYCSRACVGSVCKMLMSIGWNPYYKNIKKSMPPVSIQPTLPQLQSNQRPHSSFLPHSDPQQGPEALETEKTQGYSTLHSMDHTINYNIGSQSQALRFPFPPGSYPLPPEWQKTPWTGFSADQLQHLEAMFQEDKFPDIEKKRLVAASFGVTPHNIKVWFRNRRSRWRKENAVIANVGDGQSRVGYTPHHQISPTLAHSSLGAPPVSHFYVSKPPQFAPVPPSVPILSTQMAPSHSSLLSSLSSPGQSREWDTGQHQFSSQGGLVVFPPDPMHSPPPPLLLSPLLPPPFTMTYYSANPTPPLLNTPPFFLDPLAGGSTLTHYVTQSLPTDTSSLFDLDYLMSSQLQSSYPTSQPQLQPDTSLPSMPYLTPSPYLTPNPPDLNPTSYLTLGPEGNSSGVVTTSTSDPTCFQSQSTGQILLRSSDQDAGSAAYQPSPQGQPEQSASHAPMLSVPSCLPWHQPPSSTSPHLLPALIFYQPPFSSSLHLPLFLGKFPASFTQPDSHQHHHYPPTCVSAAASCLRVEGTPTKES